jgi:hypothetical protein
MLGLGGGAPCCSTVILPDPPPPRLPICGVVGEPAAPVGGQLTHPCPPNSPDSPTWGSVARGEGARAVKHSCPGQQPAVIAAEFTALFDRCLASGLKARLVFSHAAGHQVLTVSCNFPVPAANTATAGKRRCCHRRPRRRGRTANVAPDAPARVTTPPIATPAAPSPTLGPHLLSPETAPPPAKRTRKR